MATIGRPSCPTRETGADRRGASGHNPTGEIRDGARGLDDHASPRRLPARLLVARPEPVERPTVKEDAMKRISTGDQVSFTTTTNRTAYGTVVSLITERRQPTMVLIERHDGGRAIRLENEVALVEAEPILAEAEAVGAY